MSHGGSSGLFEAPATDTTTDEDWGSSSHTVTAASSDVVPVPDLLRVPTDSRLGNSYDMERTTAVDPMIAFERNMRLYLGREPSREQPTAASVNQDQLDCDEEENQVTLSVSNLTGHDLKPMTYIAFPGTTGLGVYVDGKRIGTSVRLIFNPETKVLRDENSLGGCLTSDSTDDDIQRLALLADMANVRHNLDYVVAWGNKSPPPPVQRCRMTYKSAFERLHMDGMFVKKEQQTRREAAKRAHQVAERNNSQMAQRRVRVKLMDPGHMERVFKEAKVSLTKMKKKRLMASDSDPCKTGFIIPEDEVTEVSDDGFNASGGSDVDNQVAPAVFVRFLDGAVHERWPKSALSLLSQKPRHTNFEVIQKKTLSSELKHKPKSAHPHRSRIFTINGTSPPRR